MGANASPYVGLVVIVITAVVVIFWNVLSSYLERRRESPKARSRRLIQKLNQKFRKKQQRR